MSTNINNLYPRPAYVSNAAVADQRLSVDGTAGGVQFTPYDGTSIDLVTLDVQTADVMVTFDTTAPTSTNGHRLYAGTNYTWSTAMFNAAKFIRATSTSATIHASALQV